MVKLLSPLLFLIFPLFLFLSTPSSHAAPSWQIVYYGSYQPNGAAYTILDLFEHSKSDVQKAQYPIAYFSAHYENWRPDAKQFGRKLRKLGNWKGEYYIAWQDAKNQAVMLRRLDLAKAKGFKGVDIDNVDYGGKGYFAWLYAEARKRGLAVGLKNYVEILPEFGHKVDFFVSEASQASELSCYKRYGKPTVRMYYSRGAPTPSYIYAVKSKRNGNRF